MRKRITLSVIAIVVVISCTKINLEPNQRIQVQESLGYEVVNSQYFSNTAVLNSLLIHYGQDTTSFTDSFRDTLTQVQLNKYLAAWGSNYEIGLDTIYKDFWNSHGTICYSPSIGFIDANSTKWDELPGVASNPFPHKSFTIMIPLGGGGNEIVYHFINRSNPPIY